MGEGVYSHSRVTYSQGHTAYMYTKQQTQQRKNKNWSKDKSAFGRSLHFLNVGLQLRHEIVLHET